MPEPEAWVSTTLGECAEFLSGGTPSKGNPAFWHGTIPWVTAKDMKSFQLANTEDHVTEIGASNGTRLVPPGTVLILVRGMTLHNSIPIGVLGRQAAFNQDIKALRAREHVDDRFLAHLLMANRPVLLSMVHAAGHGTGVLATDRLKALEVELPGLEEQRAIAGVLGALDDKIEQNRRTGEALERLARATFKAWFVDFEPVRAKADGAKTFPGMPPEVFAALPTTFTPSPLGPIPEGWEVRPLEEIIDFNPTRRIDRDGLTAYVEMSELPTAGPSIGKVGRRKAGSGARFMNGDTLFARITPCLENGKTALVDILEPGEVGWGSTEFIVMRPKDPIPAAYAYLLARSEDFRAHAVQSMSGTSGRQRVQTAALAGYPTAHGNTEVYKAFEQVIAPDFDLISANRRESAKLAEVRDYLLPRLLSGAVRVRDTGADR